MNRTRPPRTAAHADRDALIRQFADAGLVPVISTNGSTPGADIQIVKGAKAGDVAEAWMTRRGARRLFLKGNNVIGDALTALANTKRFGDGR